MLCNFAAPSLTAVSEHINFRGKGIISALKLSLGIMNKSTDLQMITSTSEGKEGEIRARDKAEGRSRWDMMRTKVSSGSEASPTSLFPDPGLTSTVSIFRSASAYM